MVARENRRLNMKTLIAALVGQCKNPRVVCRGPTGSGSVGGWAMSTTIIGNATAFEDLARIEAPREKPQFDASKPSLIGSYVVTGTDSDGKRYAGPGIVSIALAPSGALELEWDNGKQVGVGEVIGNVLAVGCLTKGRTAILLMIINPDGSLSGKWSRRTDRGYKGTETWKKV
jgi:hypothetical protein